MFLRIPTRGVTNFDIVVFLDVRSEETMRHFEAELVRRGDSTYYAYANEFTGDAFQTDETQNDASVLLAPYVDDVFPPKGVPVLGFDYVTSPAPRVREFRLYHVAWVVDGTGRLQCDFQVGNNDGAKKSGGVRSPLYPVHRTHVATFKELDAWREQFNERVK